MSSKSIKRIIQDLKSLDTKSLEQNNIYYFHDEENVFRGYAMIIGPEDTPYYHGFYFFQFDFPENYPFSPPKAKFCTYDGRTRFHPNLYISGKVCLSLLNTWRGDSWNSCQSIETVLFNLTMLFDKEPLLNEPGLNPSLRDIQIYNDIITYRNLEHSFCYYMQESNVPEVFKVFWDIMVKKTKENKDKIIDFMMENAKVKVDYKRIPIYNTDATIDYISLNKKIRGIFERIK